LPQVFGGMTRSSDRIPALDGVRAVAVLAVFASHAGIPGFSLGGMGVDAFFVLSGYLITSILLGEIKRSGSISLPRFYLRRIKRLAPALLILCVGYALVAPFVWVERGAMEHANLSALSFFYLMDYARAFWIGHNPLVHTWSLAVEEHFYLVWPLALIAMARWVPVRHWIKVLALAYLAATLWRCLSVDLFGWAPTYFRFDTRLSALMLGSLLAALLAGDCPARMRRVWTFVPVAGAFAIAAVAINLYPEAETSGQWATLGLVIAEAVSLAVILTLVESHKESAPGLLTGLLSGAALTYVGRISYGLYLYHHPLTYWLHGSHWSVVLLIGLPTALALSALSFHLVEAPILQGRTPFRLPARAAPALGPEAASGGSGA
jgi:peptidoglycan/LPS O-acetylase OafA/YrhL